MAIVEQHITKYSVSSGRRYATSWVQINVLGKVLVFNKKTIEI